MWHLITNRRNRKNRELDSLLSTVGLATAHAVIGELHQNPVTINHMVKRNIPRPTHITLLAENGQGQQYRQWVDLTYKDTVWVTFPLEFMTGRQQDISQPPLRLMMILDYDPRDRIG